MPNCTICIKSDIEFWYMYVTSSQHIQLCQHTSLCVCIYNQQNKLYSHSGLSLVPLVYIPSSGYLFEVYIVLMHVYIGTESNYIWFLPPPSSM